MQVSNKINNLILKLNDLTPKVATGSHSIEKEFYDLLASEIKTSGKSAEDTLDNSPTAELKHKNRTPSWVDPDYDYDPDNPRKPNMRELMEAISGKDLEVLYAEIDGNWQKISSDASEILYGVVSSKDDTRDWQSIMNSDDIIATARDQTGIMYEPKLEIQSNFSDYGILTEQIAVIKDNKGNVLSSLSSNTASAEKTLLNFGATKKSIPTNIEKQIDPEVFDNDLLTFLKNFDNNATSVQQLIIQSASEVIGNKLSQGIPPDELAKL